MENFGERLKEALRIAGYTQVKAAEELQISKVSLNTYVSKNRIPDSPILYRISKLVGVSMEWLLSGDESEKFLTNTPSNKHDVINTLSQDEQDLIVLYHQLPAQSKLRVRNTLDLEVQLSNETTKKQPSSTSQLTETSELLA